MPKTTLAEINARNAQRQRIVVALRDIFKQANDTDFSYLARAVSAPVSTNDTAAALAEAISDEHFARMRARAAKKGGK